MKSNKFVSATLAGLLVLMWITGQGKAYASDIMFDSCALASLQPDFFGSKIVQVVVYTSPIGLSCDTIKSVSSKMELLQLAIIPAALVAKITGLSTQFSSELAAAGLVYSNPAVLAVTVAGVSGIGVLYVILKFSMKQCEQFDKNALKDQILMELQDRYGVVGSKRITIDIKESKK